MSEAVGFSIFNKLNHEMVFELNKLLGKKGLSAIHSVFKKKRD